MRGGATLKNEGLGVDIPSHLMNMAEIAFLSGVHSFYGKWSELSQRRINFLARNQGCHLTSSTHTALTTPATIWTDWTLERASRVIHEGRKYLTLNLITNFLTRNQGCHLACSTRTVLTTPATIWTDWTLERASRVIHEGRKYLTLNLITKTRIKERHFGNRPNSYLICNVDL